MKKQRGNTLAFALALLLLIALVIGPLGALIWYGIKSDNRMADRQVICLNRGGTPFTILTGGSRNLVCMRPGYSTIEIPE